MKTKWLVMNIGCIECGVSSKIVGVFSDKEKADKIAKACSKVYDWREGGQNSFEVFKVPVLDTIDQEYELDDAF